MVAELEREEVLEDGGRDRDADDATAVREWQSAWMWRVSGRWTDKKAQKFKRPMAREMRRGSARISTWAAMMTFWRKKATPMPQKT